LVSARLSLPAVDFLFEDLELGRPPQPFDVPSVGETMDERQRLREATYRVLERSGVVDAGRVNSQVEDMLVVLARAPVAIALSGDVDGALVLARACTDGQDAVVAHQEGNAIVVRSVRPAAIIPELLSMLPDIPAGQGAEERMPMAGSSEEPRYGQDDDEFDPMAMARVRPSRASEGSGVLRLFARPRLGFGAINAQVRKSRRGVSRWAQVCRLTWWDFDQENGSGPGRWYTTIDGDPPYLTLHPGDSRRIASYLQRTLAAHLE